MQGFGKFGFSRGAVAGQGSQIAGCGRARRHPEHAVPADVARFPQVRLVTIRSAFGSWEKAQAEHFADGGVFDQIQASK